MMNHPTTSCYVLEQDSIPGTYVWFGNMRSLFQIYTSRQKDQQQVLSDFVHLDTGKIGVFRVDKETSLMSFISEEVKTSCFEDYLFSSVQYRQLEFPVSDISLFFKTFGIMRITLMNGYMTSQCIQWNASIDVNYFSVTFHVSNQFYDPLLLPFWTVNLRQLYDIVDTDGYAYIFFAPYQDVVSHMDTPDQHTPPIIQWGHRRGYLVQTPTGRIIYRYKDPNPFWAGYPGHAPCYETFLQNRAITTQLIDQTTAKDYCPSVYGDIFPSWEAFMNAPFLGHVPRDGPWPSSS
jgi:hypothetical protein